MEEKNENALGPRRVSFKHDGNREPRTRTSSQISDRLQLNISGEIYETRPETLARFPETLLGDKRKRRRYYSASSGQYFFDRSRVFFDSILFFYQSNGILRCPPDVPLKLFEEECFYFQLPGDAIKALWPAEVITFLENRRVDYDINDGSIKTKLWSIMNDPKSSMGKYFTIISTSMIVFAVGLNCVETTPLFKHTHGILPWEKTEGFPWSIVEFILNLWFLLELVLYTVCAPNKSKYFRSLMTWIDIAAVVPYFISLMFNTRNNHSYLRILRLVRILNFAKEVKCVQVGKFIIQTSIEEFKTLLLFLVFVVFFGGSILYMIEQQDPKSQITDVFTGCYWGLQSITTLGYGDILPRTIFGLMFASGFIMFGALTLSIPLLAFIEKVELLHGIECKMDYDEIDDSEDHVMVGRQVSFKRTIVTN